MVNSPGPQTANSSIIPIPQMETGGRSHVHGCEEESRDLARSGLTSVSGHAGAHMWLRLQRMAQQREGPQHGCFYTSVSGS